MSNQQTNVPSEPPPSYDSILNQSRPQDVRPGGGVATTSAPTGSAGASSSTGTGQSSTNNNAAQSTGVDNDGNRKTPRRGDSAHEELDVEEEDRPLPPGWVVQFSEKDDREFIAFS